MAEYLRLLWSLDTGPSYISDKLFYPVMMARSKVAFSSSDLKKMDEEKSSGSDVDNDDNS
jgi:hypothetical protein